MIEIEELKEIEIYNKIGSDHINMKWELRFTKQ